MAEQILDFIAENYKKGVFPGTNLLIHCDAGISRSAGVAIQFIIDNDDSFWFQTKHPNRLVYRTILTEYIDRGQPTFE